MTTTVRGLDRVASAVILIATLALLVVSLVWHRTPLFGVETDLLGDTVPAVRALRAGHITPDTFLFRGPGYPLFVAGVSLLTGGDEFLAARIFNVISAGVAAGAGFILFRAFLGSLASLVVTGAMLVNPVFVRTAIEAGSDMPALALALVATMLVMRGGRSRSLAAAGCVAAFAFMTRYNTLFLVPAALFTIPGRAGSARRLLAYAAGFALPVGAWLLVQTLLTGQPPRNQNFLNVAYEVYGQDMGWDRFWAQVGNPFASFLDVVLYDPVRFVGHIGRNVLTRWIADARSLMPVWIGALALPGMAVIWWRRSGWRTLALHVVLAYLVLTLVFYTPRFFLYLLPFYLSGAFGLLLRAQLAAPAVSARAAAATPRWMAVAGPIVAVALLILSTSASVGEVRRALADPPVETRLGGELLRELGRRGERVMARKPHVAYFAGMEYVPIPYTEAFTDFLTEARKTRADYLFISPVETWMHQQLSVLADSGVVVPGLEPLAHRVLSPSHYFALYRFTRGDAPAAVVEDSLLGALRRFAARSPGQAWPHTHLGGHLVTMGRFREALGPLAEAERLNPGDPLVARFQAVAHAELGEYDRSAAACERALGIVPNGSWERGFLGQVRVEQGRYADARAELVKAMRQEPANPRFARYYLKACGLGGYWEDAVGAAENILRTTPGDASARLIGARAWLALGRPDRARVLATAPGGVSGPDSVEFVRFADSLAKGRVGPSP